jgi:hypothetical protein
LLAEVERPDRRFDFVVCESIDQDCPVIAADDQSAERLATMDPLSAPAPLSGRFLQGVAGGKNVAAL